MILGAQFYSLRHKTQTVEDITETFRRTREMGYHAVQLSGIGPIPAEILKGLSEEYGLPVACTHSPLDRILNDTDALIAEHKMYGCTEIGLGAMPAPAAFHEPRTAAMARQLIADLAEPIKKIKAAGMTFAYHNHAFEFLTAEGDSEELYEIFINEAPDWNFILDTYWLTYAGRDPVEYVKRLAGRIVNIHFKDLAKTEGREICACGDGVIDFAPIIAACEETGIRYALVEQDNAPTFPDAFEEMAKSCRHLTPLVYR